MQALLTGGSGFIGGHVLAALLGSGAQVRCLVRQDSPRRNFAGRDVELFVGDLRDPAALERAATGCDAVFHCAADYRFFARNTQELYDTNVGGTRHVLEAAARAEVDRVVYTSSVGALGLHADGSPADESTPVSLDDMVGHYKRSKFLAQRVAEEWAGRGVEVVIVNPSAPIGEGDLKPTATGKVILDFLTRRVPAFVDTGLNLVDVRDVAAGHLLAFERGESGESYILGHQNLTLAEIYQLLSQITGLPAPRVELPHWIPLTVAALDTGVSRLLRREPTVALEAVRLSRYRMFFDSSKAVRELGLPQTPVVEPLRRAVDWFRENGYVERNR
jgi:dihydroflavonol-4-reductase